MIYRVIALPVALQRYVDAPPAAVRQRDIAQAMASSTKARVVLLSCQAKLGLLPQAETVADKLEAFKKPLLEAGVEVEALVLDGRPSEVLPIAIASRDCDLAIIASHSKRSAVDVPFGSTAGALVKHLKCPVVLVHPTPDDVEKARAMTIPHYPAVFTYV